MNKKFKIVLITVLAAIVLVVAVIVIASLVKPNAPAENSAPPVVAGTLPPTDEPENTPEPSPEHVNTFDPRSRRRHRHAHRPQRRGHGRHRL